jgi:hypothetical protein
LAGVRGVDLLLAARQAPVAADIGIQAPPPLRDPHRRAAALVAVSAMVWIPAVFSASMMPCSRAAPMSCRAPGSTGEIHTNRPAGSAMTCTFSP